MNRVTISNMKTKQSVATKLRRAVIWAASVVLLVSSLVSAQTGSVSQQPQKPSPGTKPVTPRRAAEPLRHHVT